MNKTFAVVFAGVPGTSKTPIANYLSYKFNLPILMSDQIRWEVREDFLVDTIHASGVLDEFYRRFKERREEALSSGKPIILDGSVDRRWTEYKAQLQAAGYQWFMIDMELSRPFMNNLFIKTGRGDLIMDYLDRYFDDHQKFIAQYSADINLRIGDHGFKDRLKLTSEALQKFIDQFALHPN